MNPCRHLYPRLAFLAALLCLGGGCISPGSPGEVTIVNLTYHPRLRDIRLDNGVSSDIYSALGFSALSVGEGTFGGYAGFSGTLDSDVVSGGGANVSEYFAFSAGVTRGLIVSKDYGVGLLAGFDLRGMTYDDPTYYSQETSLHGGSYGLMAWYGGLGLSVVRDLSLDVTLLGFFLGIPLDWASQES